MKTLSKQIEESILDGINTYKELAAIGRGFDVSAFSKMCAEQIRRKALRDVYKALSDFLMDKDRQLPMHDADWLEFAQYFAKRCGVVLDGNSEIQNNH